MRRLQTTLLMVTILMGLAIMPLAADVKKGQKIYMKTFKSKFNMSGAAFASLKTQDQWKELFDDEGDAFIQEYSEKYPKVSKMLHGKKAWKKLEHLRDFVVEYASDSGNVPQCGN